MTSAEQKNENNSILQKIKLVDENYKVSPLYTFLTYESAAFFFYFIALYAAIVFYFSTARNEIFNTITLFIAFLALFLPYAASTHKLNEKILEERNYYFILRGYSEKTYLEKVKIWRDLSKRKKVEEEPLLKALVKMKARNPRLKLEDLYTRESSLFSEKKLLEKLLYE